MQFASTRSQDSPSAFLKNYRLNLNCYKLVPSPPLRPLNLFVAIWSLKNRFPFTWFRSLQHFHELYSIGTYIRNSVSSDRRDKAVYTLCGAGTTRAWWGATARSATRTWRAWRTSAGSATASSSPCATTTRCSRRRRDTSCGAATPTCGSTCWPRPTPTSGSSSTRYSAVLSPAPPFTLLLWYG